MIFKKRHLYNFGGRNTEISTLLLSREADLEAVKNRFGFVADQWRTKLFRKGGNGALFNFTPTSKSCSIKNCLIVNKHSEIYRVKYVLHASIVRKEHIKEEYSDDLFDMLNKPQRTTNDLCGIHCVSEPLYEYLTLSGHRSIDR